MLKFFTLSLLFASAVFLNVNAQSVIKGRVSDAMNNEPLSFASVKLQGTELGAYTDSAGFYIISNLKPGAYNVECSTIGYITKVEFEVEVRTSAPKQVDFQLEKAKKALGEVRVTAADKFKTMEESPLSVRSIGVNEIQRNPGSNRDISKVLQNLPGVASTVSYRNDLLVRGGGPSENRFYLDGIEIPNINHFATQGSTGGPVGLLNVDFIREADFYTGAFPANRGNSMSSVLDLKNKDGRTDRWGGTLTSGYTATGLSLEGPLGKHANVLFSARQSYLQVLFRQIGLPFLPTFNDYEIKVSIKPNKSNDITLLGLCAVDKFAYNLSAVDFAREKGDSNGVASAQYILGNLPKNEQNNATVGVNWKHFRKNGYSTVVVSRNALNNTISKYFNNDETVADNLIYNYKSYEAETKLRAENNGMWNGFKFNYGAGVEHAYYTNNTFNRFTTPFGIDTVNFDSKLQFLKYSLFTQWSKSYANDKLKVSFGVRTDFNNYTSSMANPLEQLSPRVSASYLIAKDAHINFNTGIYYQLPSYTILGYRNTEGDLVNKLNKVKYIQCKQVVLGADWFSAINSKVSLEGFFKLYDRYPFSDNFQVSLANLGGDFGVLGNESVKSTNKGRAYGAELSYQQKLFKGMYGIFTYTFVRSSFQNAKGEYVAASWDYRNIINATIGKKFKNNWEVGTKIRYQGGQPYTPFDSVSSLLRANWDITGQGIFDFTRLNTMRTQDLFNIDLRVDKKFNFKKWSMVFYVDVQNILGTKTRQQAFLSVKRDAAGNPLVDKNNPLYYQGSYIQNSNGVRTPNIGLIVEF